MSEYWDWGNAFFEGVGSILTWLNVRALRRDKVVKGVQWQVTVFWTCWGVFNLFFYPALGLWLSFWGGVSIVAANAVWVWMVVYYMWRAHIEKDLEAMRRSTPTTGGWL